jgi:hypothetical protein
MPFALGAEVYTPSTRPYQGLPDLEYPFHDRDVLVTACGRICIYRKKINVSSVLAVSSGVKMDENRRFEI